VKNTLEAPKNSEKIIRDITEYEEPNKVFGAHDKIIWGI